MLPSLLRALWLDHLGIGFVALFALAQRLELPLDLIQLLVAAGLEIDKPVAGFFNAVKQFVQLEVKGSRVAVLCVLDQKYHEEGNNSGARIDDELPRVGITK